MRYTVIVKADAASGAGRMPATEVLEQNRGRWDDLLIGRGLVALTRAQALPGPRGPSLLQAQSAACHARAGTADATDWTRNATLLGPLARVVPSPVIELHRAVAVGVADGPRAGEAAQEFSPRRGTERKRAGATLLRERAATC